MERVAPVQRAGKSQERIGDAGALAKPRMQTFLDAMPMAKEKMIAAYHIGHQNPTAQPGTAWVSAKYTLSQPHRDGGIRNVLPDCIARLPWVI
jgi:hypothetical protein